MKKIIGIICLFIIQSVFAQSTYSFAYKLEYSFINDNQSKELFAQHYIPEKYSSQTKNSLLFLSYLSYAGNTKYLFLDDNKGIWVLNSDLENNFKIGTISSPYEKVVDDIYEEVELEKMERAPMTILNRSCTHYLVKTKIKDEEPSSDFAFCIDESNEIDNVSFVFPKQKGNTIKGLVLAVTSPYETELFETIQLTDISKKTVSINFDKQKELADYETKKAELNKLYGVDGEEDINVPYAVESAEAVDYAYPYISEDMEYPQLCYFEGFYDLKFDSEEAMYFGENVVTNICNYSYYFKRGEEEKYKTFAKSKIKSELKSLTKAGLITKKDSKILKEYIEKEIAKIQKTKPLTAEEIAAINDANNAVSAAAEEVYDDSIDYFDSYFEPYVSNYKTPGTDEDSYALDQLSTDSPLWKGLPTYCKKIDTILPNFSSSELKKHAKNYAAQMCDMYLGEFVPDQVYYKGTLDAIRTELHYFSNQRENLTTNDRKLLDEFLNSLD